MKRKSFIAAVRPDRAICLAGLFLLLAMARTVSAHGDPNPAAANPCSAWQFTPDIVLVTLLVAVLYGVGLWRSRNKQQATRRWHGVSFYAGLAAMFLALQSPIDTFSEHVFALHQVQHLLLHSLGPMLLMLAAPQGLLIAGIPEWLRRYVLAPVISSRAVRATFGFVSRPAVATLLFVGTLYFWQIPRYHDLAVLNDAVHYSMHVTMLAAGLVFFWRVFDPRPAPLGTRYLVRATMLWVNQRGAQSMSEIEEALVLRELVGTGLTQVQIAALLERHKSWVSRRIGLIERLHPELLEAIRLGVLHPGVARRLLSLPPGNQLLVAAAIQQARLGPRDTEWVVSLWHQEPSETQRRELLRDPRRRLARYYPQIPAVNRQGPSSPAHQRVYRLLGVLMGTAARMIAVLGTLPPRQEMTPLSPEIATAAQTLHTLADRLGSCTSSAPNASGAARSGTG